MIHYHRIIVFDKSIQQNSADIKYGIWYTHKHFVLAILTST